MMAYWKDSPRTTNKAEEGDCTGDVALKDFVCFRDYFA